VLLYALKDCGLVILVHKDQYSVQLLN